MNRIINISSSSWLNEIEYKYRVIYSYMHDNDDTINELNVERTINEIRLS